MSVSVCLCVYLYNCWYYIWKAACPNSTKFIRAVAGSFFDESAIRYVVPSVLWRCWLSGRKGIWPVENRVVGYWRGYLSGARCRLAYGPDDATATHCIPGYIWSLAPLKSRLVLPFWYRLTQVVLEKKPLNGSSSSSSSSAIRYVFPVCSWRRFFHNNEA